MNKVVYIVSNQYHIFTFKNTIKIVSIDFVSFHAEINLGYRSEYLFFKQLFSTSNNLNKIRECAKKLQLDIDIYLPLIKTLIERQILIESNVLSRPTKIIISSNSFLYLPKATKELHEKWTQYFEIITGEYENIVFSPVFHSKIEDSTLIKKNNWTKFIDFHGYKLAEFNNINCFECYKERIFSNYNFLEEFYLSDDLLSVGYNTDLSYIKLNNLEIYRKFLKSEYDYDLYSNTYSKIWRIFDCERKESHVTSE